MYKLAEICRRQQHNPT